MLWETLYYGHRASNKNGFSQQMLYRQEDLVSVSYSAHSKPNDFFALLQCVASLVQRTIWTNNHTSVSVKHITFLPGNINQPSRLTMVNKRWLDLIHQLSDLSLFSEVSRCAQERVHTFKMAFTTNFKSPVYS